MAMSRYQSRAYLSSAAKSAIAKAAIRVAMRSSSKSQSEAKPSYKQYRKKYPKAKSKSNSTLTQEVKSLKKGLRSLKCDQEQSLGHLTYRRSAFDNCTSSVNSQGVVSVGINTLAQMQSVVSNLLYYDPSNPGTLITANYETGTYSRDLCFKSIYGKIKATNNYQVPCECTIYLCEPVADTGSSPSTIWTSAIADNPGTGVSAITDINQYPSDFDTFKKIWKAKRMNCKILQPGQSMSAISEVKDLDYDPAVADVQSDQYQKMNKNRAWLVVVKGLIAHDTSLDQQGLAQAGVDFQYDTTYKLKYDAGVNLSFVISDNQGSAFTNGAVQSLQPTADNQSYSQA